MEIMNYLNKPSATIKEVDWDLWSDAQKEYVIKNEAKHFTTNELPNEENFHAKYEGKIWSIGKTRPDYQEECKCGFSYCFYAEPRNWSMGSDSDVWNLMKCANVSCRNFFESCL